MTMPSSTDIAPVNRRAIACIIDTAIGTGVSFLVPVGVLTGIAATSGDTMTGIVVAVPLFGALGLAWLVAHTAMQAGSGSIGMRAQGLRLARTQDGGPIGFGPALLRNVVWGLAASIVVGCFTVLFDSAGRLQGWHDKAAGAVMLNVRTPSGTAPEPPGLDAARAPRQPDDETGHPAPQTAMPGFARLPAQSAMPGFDARPGSPSPQTAPAAPGTDATDDEFFQHTVLSPLTAQQPTEDSLISFVPGVTQEPAPRPVEPTAPAAGDPAPIGPPTPTAHEAAAPPPTGVSTSIGLVFTWDDGQRTTVSDRAVFGRNPEERDGAVHVPVSDGTRSLSKTHFEAGADARDGWVIDRHSTNGTTLVRDGVRIMCPPGQRVSVRPGDALEIGDRSVRIDRHE